MINKLYENIKNFIKENFWFLVFVVTLYFTLTFPLPYSIYNGGGIISLEDRISIDNKNNNKLDINLSYVKQLKGNVITFLLSYIIPDWDLEKIDNQEYNYEEEFTRSKLLLEESINNATINAYKLSNMDCNIKGIKILVSYVFDEAETTLEVGDQIIKADEVVIYNLDEFKNVLDSKNIGDEINIEVLTSDGKTKNRRAVIKNIEGKKLTGIGVVTNYVIDESPKLDIKFKNNEAGPSGGLMLTIGIFDKLNNYNLSKNTKICGTGTIDIDGNVGEIGGVKYKLRGAVKEGCDIFITPTANYEEVKQELNKKNYNIEIYEAKNISDTLEYLITKTK